MADHDPETDFNTEDVESVIKSALVTVFAEATFDSEKITPWTNQVLEIILKGLQSMGKNYKYVISAFIMQKNGAGAHTAAGLFWDGQKDGICKVSWENSTMQVVVTVFGLAIMTSPQAVIA